MLAMQTDKLIQALSILPVHWFIVPTIGKRPLGFQWEQHPFTPRTLREQLASRGKVKILAPSQNYYDSTPTGIAILCGQNEQDFLVALDCDGSSACARIASITNQPLPLTVAFTSGRLGRAQYLFKIPCKYKQNLKSRKINTAPGEALELRGKNLTSVLPPSVHPTTGYYHWLPGCRPDETEVAIAPDWVVEQMSVEEKRRSHFPNNKLPQVKATSTRADLESVLLLLEVINPKFADNYDSWIKVGMALKSVSPNLLSAWDRWSQLSLKYQPGECQYKWDSFRQIGITVGTLYYFARIS